MPWHVFFYWERCINHYNYDMITTFAIETSCDDTSLGIVQYNDWFWSNPILQTYSQITEHQEFGGVVPELAYRLHEEKIIGLIHQIWLDRIQACDSITVTQWPWLPWSLIVGNSVAHFLADYFGKPLYEVNHIHGHIVSLLLDRNDSDCPFPWLILTVSGWHNEIYFVKESQGEVQGLHIERIWHSLDDAAGESFDKVARMLWWAHPWWPWIEQMAKHWNPRSDIHFKRILLDGKWTWQSQETIDANHLNFSFSGMKSQVYNYLQKHPLETLSEQDIADICLEFSECVSDINVNGAL